MSVCRPVFSLHSTFAYKFVALVLQVDLVILSGAYATKPVQANSRRTANSETRNLDADGGRRSERTLQG